MSTPTAIYHPDGSVKRFDRPSPTDPLPEGWYAGPDEAKAAASKPPQAVIVPASPPKEEKAQERKEEAPRDPPRAPEPPKPGASHSTTRR